MAFIKLIAPVAFQIIGMVLKSKQADAETLANFLAVAAWAQKQGLISKSLHDSFDAQADRNRAEIEQIKKEREEKKNAEANPQP